VSLLTAAQKRNHPRRQVQTLRRIATNANRRGDTAKVQAAIDEMTALDVEYQLGYLGGTK